MLVTRNTKIGQSFLKRPAEGYRLPSGWLGPAPSYPSLKVDSGAGPLRTATRETGRPRG